jgi:hypothetical protein
MNYETHLYLYSNCKGGIKQFDAFRLLQKFSTTQLPSIVAPPLLTVITILQGHPIQKVVKVCTIALASVAREVMSGHKY